MATNANIPEPTITMYTSYDCVWCGKAKEYLHNHGFDFTEKNVEDDPNIAAEALALAGRRGVPIIVVNDQVILGFQRPALDAALHLSSGD